MKIAKRISVLLISSLIVSFFTGCNFISNVMDAFDRKDRNKIAEDIVEYFNNEDVEGLKDMFCIYTKDRHDLDNEISTAFEFIGSITDYKHRGGSEGESVDEGRVSYLQYVCHIEDISTDMDSGFTYLISYAYRERCDDYKETEGLTHLVVYRTPVGEKITYEDYAEVGEGGVPRIAPQNSE